MKKALLFLAVALAFTLAAAAQETGTQTSTTTQTTTSKTTKKSKAAAKKGYQEEKKESAATEAKEKKAAKEASLTGCLAAGTAPDTYKLTHGKRSVSVIGMDLSQHVGHEVKLTGNYEKPAGAKTREFKATNVEHISDTCSAAQAASKTKTKSKSKTKTETTTPPGF